MVLLVTLLVTTITNLYDLLYSYSQITCPLSPENMLAPYHLIDGMSLIP